MKNISPQAFVDPAAKIGENVTIYPFAYIEGDVEIGDNCVIMPYVSILNGTKMGSGNTVYQNTVICSVPQDFHFVPGTRCRVEIGDNNVIRENVVIAGSLTEATATTIGNDNSLMNKVHVCHDVNIGSHCVIGISVSISPECEVHNWAILSSACVIQHKVRVGRMALLKSGSRVQQDIMPYSVFGGNPACYQGVNSYIMQRVIEDCDERTLRHVANAFRLITAGNFSLEDAVIKIHEQIPEGYETRTITDFISSSKAGIIRNMSKED